MAVTPPLGLAECLFVHTCLQQHMSLYVDCPDCGLFHVDLGIITYFSTPTTSP